VETLLSNQLCKLAKISNGLPKPHQANLQKLINDLEDYPDERLVLFLKRAGLNVSYSTLYRHRRGFCRCESVEQ
jgi:hypothetical protein